MTSKNFSDHISELINDDRLLSFSISILYRILSKYTNQKNNKEIQDKKNLNQKQNIMKAKH